jgi:DnaJ-domain-containing protein 1
MEQMELREELAEIRNQPDPYAAIVALTGRIRRQIKDLIGEMAPQFESVTPAKLEAAQELLHKMRFLQKLRREAETVEAELEDELA